MKKWKAFSILFVLTAVLFTAACAFGASADQTAGERMKAAIKYEGISMRLNGDTSGIRSVWSVDHRVVTALQDEGYTVTYGALMGIADKNDGSDPIRENAGDLTVTADTHRGYKLTDGVKSAASVLVYATGEPSYATNLYIHEASDIRTFAFTTLFGGAYEERAYYGLKMVYRAFYVLEKAGEEPIIGYVDMTTSQLDSSVVSLCDIADYLYNDYTGTNAASYRQNRLVLRAYSMIASAMTPDDGQSTENVEVLTDGTYKLLADKKFTLTATVPATGFYRVTAKMNREGGYISYFDMTRAAVGSIDKHYSRYRIGESTEVAAPDGTDDYFTSVGGESEVIGYQYLVAGVNEIEMKSTATVGLSDFALELMELPIAQNESILLDAKEDATTEVTEKDTDYISLAGVGQTVSYTIQPKKSAVYSIAVLAGLKNVVLTATVDGIEGVQTAETRAGYNGFNPTNCSSSTVYFPLDGEIYLTAGEAYTLTLTTSAGASTSTSVQRLDYILLQSRENYDPADTSIRVNLWEDEAATTSTGTLLSDGKSYYLEKNNTYKTLTFKVKALREGYYGIRMLENHKEATRLDFKFTSTEETYGSGTKIEYVSRVLGTTASNGFTGSDPNELIVDQSKLKADMSGDYYGFMYLHAGENTVTIANTGLALSIAAVEFTLDAAYRPNTNDIRIMANDTSTITGTVYQNKTSASAAAPGVFRLATAKDGEPTDTVTYSFEIKRSGNYDIYAYIGAKGTLTTVKNKGAQVALSFAGSDTDNAGFTAEVTYTHEKQYLSAMQNSGSAAYSVSFDDAIYFAAGKYTVTWKAVSGTEQNNLVDIRIIEQDPPIHVPAVEPTCKAGNIEYYYQASTGKCFSDPNGQNQITYDSTILPPDEDHQFGEWGTVTPATCDARGLQSRTCPVCDSVEYEFIAPYGHEYSSYSLDTAPTLTTEGRLVRTCTSEHHVGSITDVKILPTLGTNNGYKLHDNYEIDGENLKMQLPTFSEAGEAYFSIRVSNQMFVFYTELPSLSEYYENRTDAYFVPASDMTCTMGDDASYYYYVWSPSVDGDNDGTPEGAWVGQETEPDSGVFYNKVLVLPMPKGEDPTHEVSFSVNVAKEGYYSLYLKYCNKSSKDTRLYVYNDSLPGFTSRFKAVLGPSIKYDNPENYLPTGLYIDKDFDEGAAVTVYLAKGNNDLRLAFSDVNSTSKSIGISNLLLIEEIVFDSTTVMDSYFYDGAKKEGFRIESGSSDTVSVTVPQDGTYKLYATMSCSGGQIVIDSPANSFPTVYTDMAALQGGATNGDYKKTTFLYEMGDLNLTAGTHAIRFQMSNSSEWLHFNTLVAVRTGDMAADASFNADFDRVLDEDTHTVTMMLKLSGTVPGTGKNEMKVVFDGYYTNEDGTETPFTSTQNKVDFTDSFTYTTEALTADVNDTALAGTDGVTYQVSVYDESGDTLLYRSEMKHYTLRETLRVFMVTDLHYTGSNLQQYLWRDDLNNGNGGYDLKSALKVYDTYRTSYEAYGWSSDEKEQRVMDDILQRYKAGEFDILFLLGDQSTNDGNYQNYAEESVAYKGYGTMDDFWDSPLNKNFMLQEQFLNQLSDAGIPYYCANGNHDYLFDYNDTMTDIIYPGWEAEYHYEELFGHKTTDGIVYDATPVDFVVRAIKREGEVKILSALSSQELADFKLRNAGDGNCYDFYVSEDTLCESDVLLGAFVMINPQQFDSFEYYMERFVYQWDPDTGELIAKKHYDSHGQSIRTDYLYEDLYLEMDAVIQDFECVYLVGHNSVNANHTLSKFLERNQNIKGFFMGDVHTEETDTILGILPRWVAGCFSCAYDVDEYYERDEVTGELTTTRDDQYYYYKSPTKEQSNAIGGDYTQHPFAYVMLYVRGGESYVEREHIGFFYDNYQPQYKLMGDRVTGWDIGYERAVDYTHEVGEIIYDGNKAMYVGGDTYITGSTHLQLAQTYNKGKYNKAEYVLEPLSGMTYTVCDTAGRALNTNGKPVITDGGDALTVTLSSTDEGAEVSIGGVTYYIVSKSGGMVGHYLYDENGDFVYVDKDGNYVFYDFITDTNGEIVRDYFYEDKENNYIYIGTMGADGLLRDKNNSNALVNINLTEADIWLVGDQVKVSYVDSVESEDYLFEKVTMQLTNGKYRVKTAKIDIVNGIIVRGEGFLHYSYTYNFVYGDGTSVNKEDVKVRTNTSYTYTLNLDKVKAAAVANNLTAYQDITEIPRGKDLQNLFNNLKSKIDFESLYDITENKDDTVVGMYMPRISYEKAWIQK